jgi:integrase
MAKRHLKLVTPATVNRTVTPRRPPNSKLRTREYLTEAEVERLMNAARKNRWGHRDATMTLVAYRHGLRASELVDLRWDQIEFGSGTLHVRRVKRGTPSTHPILGDELRAIFSKFVNTSARCHPFGVSIPPTGNHWVDVGRLRNTTDDDHHPSSKTLKAMRYLTASVMEIAEVFRAGLMQ